MTELWNAYWPMILVAVAIGLIVGLIIFRPKQKVTLTKDSAPVRPHMVGHETPVPTAAPVIRPRPDPIPSRDDSDGGGEGEDVGDGIAAAAGDVVGQILDAPVHSSLPGSQGVPDDLQRMKGVGPKLAALLNQQGYTRYDQIAALTPADLARLDEYLGAFRGRLARDRVVEQAAYLARGDTSGYESQFGKL